MSQLKVGDEVLFTVTAIGLNTKRTVQKSGVIVEINGDGCVVQHDNVQRYAKLSDLTPAEGERE